MQQLLRRRRCAPTSARGAGAAQSTTRGLPGRDQPRAPASPRPSVGPARGLRLNARTVMRSVISGSWPMAMSVIMKCFQAVDCEEQKVEISKQEDSNRTGCDVYLRLKCLKMIKICLQSPT